MTGAPGKIPAFLMAHPRLVRRVANKLRVEGDIPYFYGPKYRSSVALPAPEIFFRVIAKINQRIRNQKRNIGRVEGVEGDAQ